MSAQEFITSTSDEELESRWQKVRAAMIENGLDALVMQGHDDWLGGYVRWFTDVWATNGYPRTIIFYLDQPMSVVEMGAFGDTRQLGGKDGVHRGVDKMYFTPSFFSVGYTPQNDADIVTAELKRAGVKNVGLLTPASLPSSLVKSIEAISSINVGDATDMVDHIKAIKSPEEQLAIRAACEMQDKIFEAVCNYIKPGLRDIDVINFAQSKAHELGSDNGLFLGSSSPLGISARFKPRQQQGRTMAKGEHFSMLVEVNGPGGMYTEVARTIVLGKSTSKLKDEFALMKQAQDHTLSLMKPGAAPADIAQKHNEWMIAHNLPPENRLYSHGQGYDLVERPLIRHDETMKLAAGMNLAVHPGYDDETVFAVICDNYLITDTGVSECLHKTPKQIFEIY